MRGELRSNLGRTLFHVYYQESSILVLSLGLVSHKQSMIRSLLEKRGPASSNLRKGFGQLLEKHEMRASEASVDELYLLHRPVPTFQLLTMFLEGVKPLHSSRKSGQPRLASEEVSPSISLLFA